MFRSRNSQLSIEVVQGELLSDADRANVVSFCTRAFEEDMTPFFETFVGATHVLGSLAGMLVSHALWITRYLQVGTGPLLRTAYVEAVATDPGYRNRGFASVIMQRLVDEIQDYDLAALSPFSTVYYGRLGWETWRGPLFARTEQGLAPSPDDEEVMILRLPRTTPLDLDAPLSVEWREGDVW